MLGEGFLKLKTNINRYIMDLTATAKEGKGTISILVKVQQWSQINKQSYL